MNRDTQIPDKGLARALMIRRWEEIKTEYFNAKGRLPDSYSIKMDDNHNGSQEITFTVKYTDYGHKMRLTR